MKNVIFNLGIILLLFSFSILPFNLAKAQSSSYCEWIADSDGCDVYDCGSYIMWACGSPGGMLICDQDEDAGEG